MIGYLGPNHSFTHQAARSLFDSRELQSYSTFFRLFEALNKEEVDGIVVPLENSIEGTVNSVQDKLYEYGFNIHQEKVLDIRLSLIAKTSDISNVRYVISNQVALQQCRNTLSKELGSYEEVHCGSTSKAVNKLYDLDKSYAAVASEENVQGELNILLTDCHDYPENRTRFVYVTKGLQVQPFHNKTSIIIAPHIEKSGALYDILHEFAIRGINLSKIESRPKKDELGNYLFYIDIDGNIENKIVNEALEILKIKTGYLRILGSYFTKK